MNNQYHLNRLSHPRASFGAILLLVAVFGLFGLWANAQTITEPGIVSSGTVEHLISSLCSPDFLSSVKISR